MATSNNKTPETPIKYEFVFEDDECIQIWKYNRSKSLNGPVEVETRWKRSFNPWGKKEKKTMADIMKETKKGGK
jgi:hypothetical protein